MQIIIGNIISFFASVMLFLGCYTTDPKKVYGYQIAENSILCLSSVVFQSWTGMITLLLAILRNVLLAKDKYNKKWMCGISFFTFIAGIFFNSKGIVGWLPIIATLIWSVSNYYYREILGLKLFLLMNTAIWGVYFFLIWDISSGIAQAVTCIVCLQSIYRIVRKSDIEAVELKEQ